MSLRVTLALTMLVASLTTASQLPVLAIVDVTVIPMTAGATTLRNHTVVVTGGRISALGPTAATPVPDGATRIDGRGKFLIPGLADMHVHLEYFDNPAILGLFVANGVTTVRNMDGRPYILDWRRKIAAGALPGPRIYTAGPLLDGSPPLRPDNTVVASPGEAQTIVDAQAAAGYDFIKVYSGLSRDAYVAIVSAARAKRLPVAGHVPRSVGIDGALAAGQQVIEHVGDFASVLEADTSPFKGVGHWSKRYLAMPLDETRLRAVAAQLAAARVWSVPTLIQSERELMRPAAIDAQLAGNEVSYIGAEGRKFWEAQSRRVVSRMDDEDWKLVEASHVNRRRVVAALHAAGVPILIGSDTPNPFVVPGFSLHDELSLAVTAGLAPANALAGATREAARLFGSQDWGTIERGKAADMVLLDADPMEDIGNTRRVNGVMIAGRWLNSETRAQMLNAARTAQ